MVWCRVGWGISCVHENRTEWKAGKRGNYFVTEATYNHLHDLRKMITITTRTYDSTRTEQYIPWHPLLERVTMCSSVSFSLELRDKGNTKSQGMSSGGKKKKMTIDRKKNT